VENEIACLDHEIRICRARRKLLAADIERLTALRDEVQDEIHRLRGREEVYRQVLDKIGAVLPIS